MRSTVVEGSPYPLPEETVFNGTLIRCEQVNVAYTKKGGESSNFDKWEWTFLVTDPPEYSDIEVKGGTEPKITDATDPSGFLALARPYVEALLGRSLAVGEDIDTDDLIGLGAQFTVRHQEPRARKNGDGFWFNVELNEVFPAHPTNGSAPVRQPVPATGWVTSPSQDPPF